MSDNVEKSEFFKNHYLVAFWVTLGLSIGLVVTGFFMPPEGEISPSVLKAVGLLFLWPALGFLTRALEMGKKARISKGDTHIVVGEEDDSEE